MSDKSDDRTIKTFLDKIDQLQGERKSLLSQVKVIDDKIAGLDLAFEIISGHPRAGHVKETSKPRSTLTVTRRKPSKGGYSLDKQAQARTLAYLQSRIYPATIKSVAAHFNIEVSTATQRLLALVRAGVAKRHSRGRYMTLTTARKAHVSTGSVEVSGVATA